jgi:hypothetical protein
MTSFNLNYLLKVLSPNVTLHWGLQLQHMNFRGHNLVYNGHPPWDWQCANSLLIAFLFLCTNVMARTSEQVPAASWVICEEFVSLCGVYCSWQPHLSSSWTKQHCSQSQRPISNVHVLGWLSESTPFLRFSSTAVTAPVFEVFYLSIFRPCNRNYLEWLCGVVEGFGHLNTYDLFLAPAFTSCMNLGKSLSLQC